MLKDPAWWLAQARDAWVGSEPQDASGGSGNFLGQDIALKIRGKFGPNFEISAGYDHFFKGSYIKNLAKIPGNPLATDTDFFYLQTDPQFVVSHFGEETHEIDEL